MQYTIFTNQFLFPHMFLIGWACSHTTNRCWVCGVQCSSCSYLQLCSTHRSLLSSCCIKPVIFSVFPRWHPDWYDGEKGSAGGGSHQSSRTRTKARVQISPWWEPDQPWDTKEHLTRHIVVWYALNIQGNPVDTPSQNLFCAFPSHRDIPSWEVRSRLCWWVAVFLANGFFIVLFLPSAPYVKVYLLNNGAYVAKKKTKIARKTLDPLYQQALLFEESPQGKVLQVSRRCISPRHKVKWFCFFLQIHTDKISFSRRNSTAV